MKRIKFKFGDYYDIMDENMDDISEVEELETKADKDGNIFTIKPYRMVIPQIKASFREGIWWTEDSDEPEASVILVYEEAERDINAYLGYTTAFIDETVDDVCKLKGITIENSDELDCILEIDA